MRWACLAVASIGLLGCMPPPMNVGYVAMPPGRRGGVDLSGQVGGGAEVRIPSGGGGGTLHVEPHVGKKVSFPIGFGLGGTSGPGGLLPLRFGFRHRAVPVFAWGFGLGPSIAFSDSGATAAGVADLEGVLGFQGSKVGFSFGIRPAFSFDAEVLTFFVLLEPQLAIRVRRRTSITVGVVAGPLVTTGIGVGNDPYVSGFAGGMLGAHRRF